MRSISFPMFVSEMTARGYSQMSCYDPFSYPQKPDGKFDLITCFEVIEHSPKPMETLRETLSMLSDDGAIVVGQTTQPANIDQIRGAWWYIAPRNGHVSTFANLTFFEMARSQGLAFRRGEGLYGFARRKPSPAVEAVLARIGQNYMVLLAPAGNRAYPAHWHNLERAGNALFRWTASAEIDFGAHELGAGVTQVQIPFLMEVRPEFAANCRIAVDGRVVQRESRTSASSANLAVSLRGHMSLNCKRRNRSRRTSFGGTRIQDLLVWRFGRHREKKHCFESLNRKRATVFDGMI